MTRNVCAMSQKEPRDSQIRAGIARGVRGSIPVRPGSPRGKRIYGWR
jgi:hypothetical protein